MGLSLKEAAHRMRMTVNLLLWAKSYSLKRDGRKLRFNADGTIDEGELDAFNAYMRAEWPDKNPGAGVLAEIGRESRGLCGLCMRPSDATEIAHIDRLGIESEFHWQHPHNLINLCVECHTRYDRLRTITNDQVKHAKEQLIARLMEHVDRDLEMQRQLQIWVGTNAPALVSAWNTFRQGLAQHAETVVTGSATSAPASAEAAGDKLSFLSGSLGTASPGTSRLLSMYATSVKNDEPPPNNVSVEDLFDDSPPRAGKCYRDGADTQMEYASCSECGEDPGFHLVTSSIGDGNYELFDEDFRGDVTQIVCDCGSKSFEVEFEALCEYCANMSAKDD